MIIKATIRVAKMMVCIISKIAAGVGRMSNVIPQIVHADEIVVKVNKTTAHIVSTIVKAAVR